MRYIWISVLLLMLGDFFHGCARAEVWNFEPVVIDEHPPQPRWITDVTAVDIDNDGRTDLWFSGSHIPSQQRKSAWYRNTGDPHQWEHYTPFSGPSLDASWGDVDGDVDMAKNGDLDVLSQGFARACNDGRGGFDIMENIDAKGSLPSSPGHRKR